MDLKQLLRLAETAARDAVAVHRRHLGTIAVEDWAEKGASDFVTHVDREAEALIVEMIRETFPDHAILAEEAATADGSTPAAAGDAEWRWYVDPLDGTTNFLHGYPAFSASVAVARAGEVQAGAVVHGSTGECWTAVRGGGAFKDGRRIHVSSVGRLRIGLVGTGFPFKRLDLLPRYLSQFDAVLRGSAGIRRAGSAALDLCHVATGYLDGFWELVLAPWDIAAGLLIVREAGGVATGLDGEVLRVDSGGPVIAGNPDVHEQLRRLLAAVETPAAAAG